MISHLVHQQAWARWVECNTIRNIGNTVRWFQSLDFGRSSPNACDTSPTTTTCGRIKQHFQRIPVTVAALINRYARHIETTAHGNRTTPPCNYFLNTHSNDPAVPFWPLAIRLPKWNRSLGLGWISIHKIQNFRLLYFTRKRSKNPILFYSLFG